MYVYADPGAAKGLGGELRWFPMALARFPRCGRGVQYLLDCLASPIMGNEFLRILLGVKPVRGFRLVEAPPVEAPQIGALRCRDSDIARDLESVNAMLSAGDLSKLKSIQMLVGEPEDLVLEARIGFFFRRKVVIPREALAESELRAARRILERFLRTVCVEAGRAPWIEVVPVHALLVINGGEGTGILIGKRFVRTPLLNRLIEVEDRVRSAVLLR